MQQSNIAKTTPKKEHDLSGHIYCPMNILINCRRIISLKSFSFFFFLSFNFVRKVLNISSDFTLIFMYQILHTKSETCAASLGFVHTTKPRRFLSSNECCCPALPASVKQALYPSDKRSCAQLSSEEPFQQTGFYLHFADNITLLGRCRSRWVSFQA